MGRPTRSLLGTPRFSVPPFENPCDGHPPGWGDCKSCAPKPQAERPRDTPDGDIERDTWGYIPPLERDAMWREGLI